MPKLKRSIDHRRRHNVVQTSVTHSDIALCATFFFIFTTVMFYQKMLVCLIVEIDQLGNKLKIGA